MLRRPGGLASGGTTGGRSGQHELEDRRGPALKLKRAGALAGFVAVDATIIRVLLVPATMRLMGKWDRWAPGILGRLVDQLGFSHVEDEEVSPPAPVPSA